MFSSDDQGKITSFIDFKGSLEAPSAEGYNEGLTKAKDAREFVVNVTNFVLGFLGLLAIIIVIYGGFLYITDAGKAEQAEKGKKAITYAIIGIIIILSSFAIVNTVLKAPTGTDKTQNTNDKVEVEGTSVKYKFNVLAKQVETTAKDIVTSYKLQFEIAQEIKNITEELKSAKKHINNCAGDAWSEGSCGDNWSDGLKDRLYDTDKAFQSIIKKLENIKNKIKLKNGSNLEIENNINTFINLLNKSFNKGIENARHTIDGGAASGCGDVGDSITSTINSCDEDGNKLVWQDFRSGINFDNIETQFKALHIENFFQLVINQSKLDLKETYKRVSEVTDVANEVLFKLVDENSLKSDDILGATLDSTNWKGELQDLANAVNTEINNILAENDTDKIIPLQNSQQLLKSVLTDLYTLYKTLQNVVFVDAKIKASVIEGNAPLLVTFSSEGSLDPSGITIQEKQISWDLDGDGKYNSPVNTNMVTNCKEVSKVAVACTYLKPGTYRVKLKIKPTEGYNESHQDKIEDGLGIENIKENPAKTKINSNIQNLGENGTDISKYDENGYLLIDRNQITVPLSVASTGLRFDATLTKTKEGPLADQANVGATVYWDFGDDSSDGVNKTKLKATEGNLIQTHKYNKEGSYTVLVEFTDKNKVIDRKIFTLKVTKLAPQITITPQNPKVGTAVTFDGTDSISDNGQITSYKWTFSPELEDLKNPIQKDRFTYTFKKPGTYTVSLTVEDGVEDPKTTDMQLNITSDPPIASFTYEFPYDNYPSLLKLKSKSYDPDGSSSSLQYKWTIDGEELKQVEKMQTLNYDYSLINPEEPIINFHTKKDYEITLIAIDPKGAGDNQPQESKPFTKTIKIDNLLNVTFGNNPVTAVLRYNTETNQQEAPIAIQINSDNASSYEVEYGDGEVEQGEINKQVNLIHNYQTAGTYTVKATVYDADNKQNSISKKVYINSDDTPSAVITVFVNNEEVIDTTKPIEINRKDVVTFTGEKSINTDGTSNKLSYTWSLGDGAHSTRKKVNHTYKDIGDYEVKLKVTNTNKISQTSTDIVHIRVKGEVPFLRSVSVVPEGSLITPVTVKLKAIGAEDPDGKITTYKWWYFDPNNDAEQMGIQITTTPQVSLKIGTKGATGEKRKYNFAVELTDNENNTVSSLDILPENMTPSLTVTNGPNEPPIAKFSVDRTNITQNQNINFVSSSVDKDGEIVAYYWDFEGDGFANNTQNEGPNVSHTFKDPAPNGIKVRLKVVDNNDSEAISDPVTIYVDSIAKKPVASFKYEQVDGTTQVKFKNTSTVDTENNVKIKNYKWDFDISVDDNGDGIKNNDIQSTEENPIYSYPDYKLYRAKLTIEDSNNNTATVTNFINLKKTNTHSSAPSSKDSNKSTTLKAKLITDPLPSIIDNKVHLTGDQDYVTLNYAHSKGDIVKYIIDKNIYYDTDGDGILDNDKDNVTDKPGQWRTIFKKSYGKIKVKLTVIDKDGNEDSVEKEIVFKEKNQLSTNILTTENSMFVILLLLTSLGALVLKEKNKFKNKQNGR